MQKKLRISMYTPKSLHPTKQMGFGKNFYYELSNAFGDYAYIFAGMLAISGFFFWILDIHEWSSAMGKTVRFFSLFAMCCVFLILVVLVSHEIPFGIISLYAVINPLWLLAVKVNPLYLIIKLIKQPLVPYSYLFVFSVTVLQTNRHKDLRKLVEWATLLC